MGLGTGQLISSISRSARGYARYLATDLFTITEAMQTPGVVGQCNLATFSVPWPVVIDGIYYEVGGTSAGNVRAGIYEDGPAGDIADGGALLVESASVAQAGAQTAQFIPIPETVLKPGVYWIALQVSDATATIRSGSCTGDFNGHFYNRGGGYGPFTNPCPVTAAVNRMFHGGVRVATNLPMT